MLEMNKSKIYLFIITFNLFFINTHFTHASDHTETKHLIPSNLQPVVSAFFESAKPFCRQLLNRETYSSRESYITLLQDVGSFLKDKQANTFIFDKDYLSNSIINFDDKNSYYFIYCLLQTNIHAIGTELNLCLPCQNSKYANARNLEEFDTENLKIPVVWDTFNFIILFEFIDRMYRSVKIKFILNYNNNEEHLAFINNEIGLHPHIQTGCAIEIRPYDNDSKVNVLSLPDDENFFYMVNYVQALLEPNIHSTILKIEEMKQKKEEYKAMEYGRIVKNTYCWVFF